MVMLGDWVFLMSEVPLQGLGRTFRRDWPYGCAPARWKLTVNPQSGVCRGLGDQGSRFGDGVKGFRGPGEVRGFLEPHPPKRVSESVEVVRPVKRFRGGLVSKAS